MGKAPFSEIALRAWKASSLRATTLVFGSFVALGMAAEQIAFQAMWHPDANALVGWVRNVWQHDSGAVVLVMAIAFFARVFGRANLIAALSIRKRSWRFGFSECFSRFTKVLSIDVTVFSVLVFLVAIFAFPPLLALSSRHGAFEGAVMLSAFAFIPVLLTAVFVREYGTFYSVLSSLRFGASLDRGAALFSKFAMRSVWFWLFSLMIAAGFTFLLNAAMLGTSSLFAVAGFPVFGEYGAVLIGAIGLVWYAVFDQALFLRFFEDIAAGKDKEQAPSGEQVLDPSLPPVA